MFKPSLSSIFICFKLDLNAEIYLFEINKAPGYYF